MKRICSTLIATCIVSVCQLAWAHHGVELIGVRTTTTPEQGAGFAILRTDYIADTENETEFEPAFLYGVTDRLAVELHGHIEKESGESGEFESWALAAQYRLTPAGRRASLGIGLEYEIARDAAEPNAVELTGIASYDAGRWAASANLVYEDPTGEAGEWGYAAGLRNALDARHGFGFEVEGSFESSESATALVGWYLRPGSSFSLNAGVGTGLSGGPDLLLRTAFIWQFR